MGFDLAQRLVTDELWDLVEALLPTFGSRRQGGGTAPLDERKVFTAVVYVLMSDCPWRQLPLRFDVSPATAHRRFSAWVRADLWRLLHTHAETSQLPTHERHWVTAIVLAAYRRAKVNATT